MDESQYLEQVRQRTNAPLWILFLAVLALTMVYSGPMSAFWATPIILIFESSMVTMFIMRHDWVRVVLFGLFALGALGLIIG